MRNIRISDLLYGLEAPDVGLKDTAAVSAERIKEIAMKKIHSDTIQRTSKRKHPAALILAAALALALSATALAAYRGSNGPDAATREVHTNILLDREGNVTSRKRDPSAERAEADKEEPVEPAEGHAASAERNAAPYSWTYQMEQTPLKKSVVGVLTLHAEP